MVFPFQLLLASPLLWDPFVLFQSISIDRSSSFPFSRSTLHDSSLDSWLQRLQFFRLHCLTHIERVNGVEEVISRADSLTHFISWWVQNHKALLVFLNLTLFLPHIPLRHPGLLHFLELGQWVEPLQHHLLVRLNGLSHSNLSLLLKGLCFPPNTHKWTWHILHFLVPNTVSLFLHLCLGHSLLKVFNWPNYWPPHKFTGLISVRSSRWSAINDKVLVKECFSLWFQTSL